MEKIETFWQSLWRKKKKRKGKAGEDVSVEEEANKENVPWNPETRQKPPRAVHPQNSVVKQRDAQQGGETLGSGKMSAPASPLQDRAASTRPLDSYRGNLGVSVSSLRGRRQEPYDRQQWVSNQHFHIPQGTQRYQSSIPRWKSSSRGALSAYSIDMTKSLPRSHSPTSSSCNTMMRRPIEPSISMHHFHVPTNRRKRLVYGRPGQKTGMRALADEMKASRTVSTPGINNEEPIQLAHYPGGTPRVNVKDNEELEEGEPLAQPPEDEGMEDRDAKETELVRRREEELSKISSGIGKVFLHTIRQTERIKNAKLQNIDPRSAARTPGANREPSYKLRYNSPAWASPSRDTMHARPWDSLEDLERPVVLTSSGCASGCTSDSFPPVKAVAGTPHSVTPTLPRAFRPGYSNQPFKASTMPHIRSVSGRILDDELEMSTGYAPAATSTPTPGASSGYSTMPAGSSFYGLQQEVAGNNHSGILYSTNNNFSWLTLAHFQNQDTLRKSTSNKFFKRPELRHNGTILDL